jgi:hypothetical protein
MQNFLDTVAASFATTAMKHTLRETLVEQAVESLTSEQADRFMAIAFGDIEI